MRIGLRCRAVVLSALIVIGVISARPIAADTPFPAQARPSAERAARERLRHAYARDRLGALLAALQAHCTVRARVETLIPVHNRFSSITYYQGNRIATTVSAGSGQQEERVYDRARRSGWERHAGYVNDLAPADLVEARQSLAHTFLLLADLDRPGIQIREAGMRRLPNGARARRIRLVPASDASAGSAASPESVPTDFYLNPQTDRLIAIGYRDRDPHRDVMTENLILTVAWMPTAPGRVFAYPQKQWLYEDGLPAQRILNEKIDCVTPIASRRFERPTETDRFSPNSRLPTRVPLQFTHGYCVVAVTVNGAKQTGHFLLDTGAASSTLSLPLARQSGLRLGKTVTNYSGLGNFTSRLCQVQSLRVGEAEVRSLPVDAVTDDALDRLAEAVGTPIDGILGNDFFRAFQMTLDYGGAQGPELVLDRPDAPTPPGPHVPFFLSGGAPAVPAHLPGGDLTMAVDSGAPTTWLPPRYVSRLPANLRADWLGFAGEPGGTRLVWLTEIVLRASPPVPADPAAKPPGPAPAIEEVALKDQIGWSVAAPSSTRPTGSLLSDEYEGLFGSDLLRYFRATFDYRRGVLVLVMLPQPAVSRGDYIGVGIWPEFRAPRPQGQEAPHRVFVAHLWPFSPAARAGVRVGEELLEIEGKPVQALSERQITDYLWHGSEGKPLHLLLRGQGDARRTLDLVCRRLF